MADCFCGCQRSVAAIGHKRRANNLGASLITAIPMARGALARLPRFAEDAELLDLVATGPPLLTQLTEYVHGDLDRGALDSDGLNDWQRRWASRYAEILMSLNGWAGLNPFKRARLVLAGERAQATVVNVRDTGTTVNQDPKVELVFLVEPPGAPVFEAKRKLVVPRINIPRPGMRLEVAYDPTDRTEMTFYKPDVTEAVTNVNEASAVDDLTELSALHTSGALSDEEFRAAKARLLGLDSQA